MNVLNYQGCKMLCNKPRPGRTMEISDAAISSAQMARETIIEPQSRVDQYSMILKKNRIDKSQLEALADHVGDVPALDIIRKEAIEVGSFSTEEQWWMQ